MLYKDFHGRTLSALGLGCMRLPTVGGKDAEIDVKRSEEMFDYAISNGINYFDTAWPYHGGNSEQVTGDILANYKREKWNIASKFPGWSKENIEKAKEIFETQLKRCRVDKFDFYLFHCISDSNIEGYLDKQLGLADYIFRQKQEGKIDHVGFSVHASTETTKRFLDAFGENIDFCQIQLNYLDLTYQKANACKKNRIKNFVVTMWGDNGAECSRYGTLPALFYIAEVAKGNSD
nr:aldo/keto reductase [Clostridia bacterium]